MTRIIAATLLFAMLAGPFIGQYADWRAMGIAAVIGLLYVVIRLRS